MYNDNITFVQNGLPSFQIIDIGGERLFERWEWNFDWFICTRVDWKWELSYPELPRTTNWNRTGRRNNYYSFVFAVCWKTIETTKYRYIRATNSEITFRVSSDGGLGRAKLPCKKASTVLTHAFRVLPSSVAGPTDRSLSRTPSPHTHTYTHPPPEKKNSPLRRPRP